MDTPSETPTVASTSLSPKHRGRKSAAELSVIPLVPFPRGPEPPAHLSPEEAAIWRGAVDGMRPGWFTPATETMLSAYCTMAAAADRVGRELRKYPVSDARFARFARLHHLATRSMLALATKLRLCPSSNRVNAAEARMPRRGPRPWDITHDDPA